MKTIRILCQYSVLLICVAACGIMMLCLGVGAFAARVADLLQVGWQECRKLSALLVLGAISAGAGQTTLEWDPVVGATNYILVARTNSLNNTNALSSPMRIATGTNTQATILNLAAANTYNFGVMAQNATGISDLSNILPIKTPPATSMKVVQAQYAVITTNGLTSFVDAVGVAWQLIIGGQK